MNKIILRLYAIIIGTASGIFLGVIVFGTAFRIILDLIFQWGDSGPSWVNWTIAVVSFFSTVISLYLSIKWINSFIEKTST